jgi:hypothetical protein
MSISKMPPAYGLSACPQITHYARKGLHAVAIGGRRDVEKREGRVKAGKRQVRRGRRSR